ncbi:hypothetical protein CN931_26435 [Bacillus sp. AFS054943]|uniref:Uncharacterized protein n=1 Tax=Bacillus cereus TaxID=1396 RepID=A0A2C1L5J9_BACCE|nr:hypothetical protein CN931_26435 [Bacillus sp. AFS054943]PGU00156.1 hypothetical protein COD19_17575 [Bacillus cereus]
MILNRNEKCPCGSGEKFNVTKQKP